MYAILPLTVSEWSEDATTASSCPPGASDYPAPLSLTQPLAASDHVTSWQPAGDVTEKILLAIYRDRLDVAWGFRIQGGREFGTPLVVQKVFPGTPADGQLLEGDVIHFIDGHAAPDLLHNRALEIIKNATGYLNFTIERKLGFKPAQPMPVFTHYNTPVSNNFAPPQPIQPDAKTGKRTILRREVEKVEKLENSIIFKPIYDTLPWPKEQHGQAQQQQQPTESQVSTDVYRRPVGKVVVKRGSSAKFREKPVDRLYKVPDSLDGVPTGLKHPGWVPKAKSSPKPAPVEPPKQPYKSMAEKLDDPNYLPNLLHREPSPEVNKPAPRRQIIADFAEVKKEEDVPAWLGSLRSTGALLPFEKRAELLHGSDPDPDFQYESVHQRVGEIQSKKFGEWESTEYGVETSEAKEYPADHAKSTESHPKADSSAEVKPENLEVSPGQPLQNGIGPETMVEHAETTNVLEAKPDVSSGVVVAGEIKQEVPVASESEGVKKEPTAASLEPAGSSGPETVVPEAKIEQHTVAETEKAPDTKPEQPAAAKPDVIPETKQEHVVVPEPEKVSEIKQEQATAQEAEKVPEAKQEQQAASEPEKVSEPKPEPATVPEPEKVPETKEAVAPAEPEKVPEPKPEPVAATEPEKVPEPKPEQATVPEPVKVLETKEAVAPAEPEKASKQTAPLEPEKVPETKQEQTAAPAPENVPEPKPEQAAAPAPENVSEPKPEQVAAPAPENVPEPKPEQAAAPAPENAPEPKPEQAAAPAPENVSEPKPEQAAAPAPEIVSEPKPEQAAAPAPENIPEPQPEQAAVPAENVSSEASQDNQGQSSTPETIEVKQQP